MWISVSLCHVLILFFLGNFLYLISFSPWCVVSVISRVLGACRSNFLDYIKWFSNEQHSMAPLSMHSTLYSKQVTHSKVACSILQHIMNCVIVIALFFTITIKLTSFVRSIVIFIMSRFNSSLTLIHVRTIHFTRQFN